MILTKVNVILILTYKIFYRQIAGYQRGVVDHRVGQ